MHPFTCKPMILLARYAVGHNDVYKMMPKICIRKDKMVCLKLWSAEVSNSVDFLVVHNHSTKLVSTSVPTRQQC